MYLVIVCLLQLFVSGQNSNSAVFSANNTLFNMAPYGAVCSWEPKGDPLGKPVSFLGFNQEQSKDSSNIGISWWEARDIQQLEVVYRSEVNNELLSNTVVQYWHDTWPEEPPHMPSMEDMEDDPWRGEWVTAETNVVKQGNKLIYSFSPLLEKELPGARFLPKPVEYRRTLKIRLLYRHKQNVDIESINVFSPTVIQKKSIRVEFLDASKKSKVYTGGVEVYNGTLKDISDWNFGKGDHLNYKGRTWSVNLDGKKKGIILDLISSGQMLPGSNDETVVTIKSSEGTFSFSITDLLTGPIYIPDFNVYITAASDPVNYSASAYTDGAKIRDKIKEQPEQSYERARNEIPHLDPLKDQHGGRIYLPLACDASWQKFAVEWGGNIIIDKYKAKVTAKALTLCTWNGDALEWGFGTGATANYERNEENCRMSVLNDYLPVVHTDWNHEGLLYSEEAFVSSAGHGPLSPTNPRRDEYAPDILMVKINVSNPAVKSQIAHLWLRGNSGLSRISYENGFVFDQVGNEKYIRCFVEDDADKAINGELIRRDDFVGIHQEFELGPNESRTLYFYFPFVGNLTSIDETIFTGLDYSEERSRIIAYWRDLVAANTVFSVPERGFSELSKSVIPHIRMSVTKDPQSGLYMVPAASFNYAVYANESIFQTILLDRLGDFGTVSDYLETFLKLQGSRKLPGAYTGDQKAVLHGVKVSEDNDLTALGYNMNHGTVLWGLAHHYMYSKDKEWLKKAAPNMIKAADWIIEQRNQTKVTEPNGTRVLHYGLLPAGMLEDCPEWRYWYATNAYSYLGMKAMSDAFADAGLPEAMHYKKEASSYREDILNSLQRAMELSPVVKLRDNTYVPYVPVQPYQRFRYFGSKKSKYYDRYGKGIYPTLRLSSTREVLYGPVTLMKTGVIDSGSPMAEWILDDWEENLTLSTSMNLNTHGWVDDGYWFSRGGMVFQANLQNPVSAYLERRESKAALRSLYNNFVSLFYPDVVSLSEEYRMWEHASGPFYKTPDEARLICQVIDLLIMEKDNEVWLGSGIPERWLEPGKRIELNGVCTKFGKYSYCLKQGTEASTIIADITLPENSPKTLFFVRAPFQKPIRAVKINGQEWLDWDASQSVITLPQKSGAIHLHVTY